MITFIRFTRLKRTLRDLTIGFILGVSVVTVGGDQLAQAVGQMLAQAAETVKNNLGRIGL